jgi:penicillin-binding protein-related factor A (putative recombinase)
MRETVFQKEWRLSFHYYFPTAHFVKVPDMPRVGDSRFVPRKPYDCYAFFEKVFAAFELKWMKSLTGFPFNAVTQYQVESLMEVYQNRGGAYIVINYRNYDVPEKQQREFEVPKRVNLVALIDVEHFVKLDEQGDRASIPFKQILDDEDIYIFHKKRGEKHWNLPGIFLHVNNNFEKWK